MTTKLNYWKLGLFVVAGAGLLLGSVVWFGAARLRRETTPAYAYFDERVSGLEIGSAVKFRGIRIGRVAGITAAPDGRHVEVRADLFVDELERLGFRDPDQPPVFGEGEFVSPNLRVQIERSLLTGVAYVESDYFDPEQYPLPTYPFQVPWNTVHWVPATFKSLETALRETLTSIPPLAEQATSFLESTAQAIEDLDAPGLSGKLRDLLETLQRVAAGLEDRELLARGGATLDEATQALGEIRAFIRDLRADDGAFKRAVVRLDSVGALLEDSLERADLGRATASLAAAGEEIAGLGRGLRAELGNFRRTMDSLRRLADLLQRDPGALLHGKTVPARPRSGQR